MLLESIILIADKNTSSKNGQCQKQLAIQFFQINIHYKKT